MTTIVLAYKGVCEGGPWHGQTIDAEFGFVPATVGVYRWNKNVWQWKPRREDCAPPASVDGVE